MNIVIPPIQLYNNPAVKFGPSKNGHVDLHNSRNSNVSFGDMNNSTPPVELRTQLVSSSEKEKYLEVVKGLDSNVRKNVDLLLKTGVLLNSNSNDKSTVLDNLYNIKVNPRAKGLNSQIILSDTVNTIVNPFLITQKFGDIPRRRVKSVIEEGTKNEEASPSLRLKELNSKSIDVFHSNTCVAASIEFNLANRAPAEFARFAEGLTSKNVSVQKNVKLSNLTDKTLDSVWLLDSFKIPYKMDNFDEAKVTLAPDKNAIIRAKIQTVDRDPLERSVVDVMMQSTFMNVGSQQTYNSLTDTRSGDFSHTENGLIEFEKTFTESIVEDMNKTSVTYQDIDENGTLVGYEKDSDTVKRHILDSLDLGENIIVGYVEVDKNKKVIMAHEITIIGAKTDRRGNLIFICNDTDDDKAKPIEYLADDLVPKINHAGLPQKVVEQDAPYADSWVESLNFYKELKKQKQAV